MVFSVQENNSNREFLYFTEIFTDYNHLDEARKFNSSFPENITFPADDSIAMLSEITAFSNLTTPASQEVEFAGNWKSIPLTAQPDWSNERRSSPL